MISGSGRLSRRQSRRRPAHDSATIVLSTGAAVGATAAEPTLTALGERGLAVLGERGLAVLGERSTAALAEDAPSAPAQASAPSAPAQASGPVAVGAARAAPANATGAGGCPCGGSR